MPGRAGQWQQRSGDHGLRLAASHLYPGWRTCTPVPDNTSASTRRAAAAANGTARPLPSRTAIFAICQCLRQGGHACNVTDSMWFGHSRVPDGRMSSASPVPRLQYKLARIGVPIHANNSSLNAQLTLTRNLPLMKQSDSQSIHDAHCTNCTLRSRQQAAPALAYGGGCPLCRCPPVRLRVKFIA